LPCSSPAMIAPIFVLLLLVTLVATDSGEAN
jgi:hypothetical protein